jgi:hypothetical protein
MESSSSITALPPSVPLWRLHRRKQRAGNARSIREEAVRPTIVTGGQALGDTLKGFTRLADSSAERKIVVWLNEYFGVIERDVKTSTDMLAYKESEPKAFGLVYIAKRNQDTFGVTSKRLSVAKKITMPDIKRMISEVAAENGIRVEPGDPLFALVTMNRLVLEASARKRANTYTW